MKVLVCIPARYGSTRFAGKVLAKDSGKFLIQHTYEQARLAKLPDRVVIAADDKRIAEAAASFGAECVMTSTEHQSGTDRIAEAIERLADSGQRTADSKKLNAKRYTLCADDIVINVQADEPDIDPSHIDFLAELLIKAKDCPMATLASPFQTAEQIADPNIVKVIVDKRDKAIYFSRSPIPYDRQNGGIGDTSNYLRHIGIYAYRWNFLPKITALPQTILEKTEKLEQLRVIENGFDIIVGRVEHFCDGIDTQEQYAEFVKRNKSRIQ